MKRPIQGRWAGAAIYVLLASASPGLRGQTPVAPQTPPAPASSRQEAPPQTPAKPERFAVGFRVRSLPFRSLSVMDNNRIMTTTLVSRTAYDWALNTNSRSPRFGGGPAVEIRLGRRMTATAELIFHRLRYERKTDIYSGTDDPATSNDERSHTNMTENTKARLWDLPLMLHYRGLRSSGILSRLYLAAGVSARTASRVRTANQVTNADGSSSSDAVPTQASRRNLLGPVVGIGFRFIDDFNIKVTPEVRYTRWSGATFASDTTRSPKDQLEFGIGFTR